MSGDLRAAVEALPNPYDEGAEATSEAMLAVGFEKGRAAVLALIPEGAVLVTEESLRDALRQIQIWPADGDYAAVIMTELRGGT